MLPLSHQFGFLLLLALPIACASWTVTHEEVFREPREFCVEHSKRCRTLIWIANVYMSVFNRLRLEIKLENVTITKEQRLDQSGERTIS